MYFFLQWEQKSSQNRRYLNFFLSARIDRRGGTAPIKILPLIYGRKGSVLTNNPH